MNKPIKIAIADNYDIVRKGLIHLINSWSEFSVSIEVSNGYDLFQLIESTREKPDICIFEIALPGMSGYDLMNKLQNSWPGIKGLALSVYESEFCIKKMFQNGAAGYLCKTDAAPNLYKALKDIFYKGYYYSDEALKSLVEKRAANRKTLEHTDKEIAFLSLCCKDLSYGEIAREMGLSVRTVEDYSMKLFDRLNIKSRTGLITYAIRNGMNIIN